MTFCRHPLLVRSENDQPTQEEDERCIESRPRNSGYFGAAVALSLMALPRMASAQTYDVTITNLTKGQIFAPPVVYSHRSSFDLFTPGESAIPELAGLAEDAANDPLVALLSAEPKVADVSVGGGVVLPGESIDGARQGLGSRTKHHRPGNAGDDQRRVLRG